MHKVYPHLEVGRRQPKADNCGLGREVNQMSNINVMFEYGVLDKLD